MGPCYSDSVMLGIPTLGFQEKYEIKYTLYFLLHNFNFIIQKQNLTITTIISGYSDLDVKLTTSYYEVKLKKT